MTAAAVVAVVAALVALGAALAALVALRRSRDYAKLLDEQIERGRARFDEIVARELEERAAELERTLARERADSLSTLAAEERRIAEARRRDVAEREREATARLVEAVTVAQGDVEQRLAGWAADLEKLQSRVTAEIQRIAQRQQHLTTEIEARIAQEADRLQGTADEYRASVARLREEFERATRELGQVSAGELEQHAAERRRALHEVAERLRRRERELEEQIEREQVDAMQRIGVALGDVEQRQVEQLRRSVGREAARLAEAAAVQFEATIRTAREEAARRLGRELDLAVERFSREADGVLAERVDHVSQLAVQTVEARLAGLRDALAGQRDEALGSLERRAHEMEEALRERLQKIAAEAETERAVLDTRLQELARRVDELAARA